MISTEQELATLVERAQAVDSVAIDTEFIWERTFYPRLGLIQLALSDEACYLIDPLAIHDLSSLGTLLANKNVVKILHDAPQDLAILSRVTRSIPANIFDTRLAAGFTGLPSTISLVNLISELLEINLPKTQTRTNWLQRPLDEKQVSYALDDVRYLRAVRVLLLTRIIVPEIKAWLQDELSMFDKPEIYIGLEDHDRFKKIAGAGNLNRDQLAVLRELAAWREQEARHLNRPRGHIVTDKTLIAVSKSNTTNLQELEQSGVLSAKKAKNYGQSIIKAVEKGAVACGDERPRILKTPRLKVKEKQLFEKLSEYVKLKCDMQGIDQHLIGTTSEFKQLAKNINSPGKQLPPRLTTGWRRQFLEEFFRQRF